MKILSLLLMCAAFAGCSSVSPTNSNSTGATASVARQYHAHTVTDYSSDGATTFLEMSPDDDANNR
jgi:uncharacterized protein YceK